MESWAAVISGVFSAGIVYGMLKTKIEELTAKVKAVEGNYLPVREFDRVVSRIEGDIKTIQSDIKVVLQCVTK